MSALLLRPAPGRSVARLRRLRRVWAACTLLLLTTAFADNASAAPDTRSLYTGTFRFVGGNRERAALERAVDDASRSASWIERPFLRRRLRERTQIVPWVRFSFPPGMIRTVVPDHQPAVSPDTGAEVDYWLDGEKIRMRQWLQGERLLQSFRAQEGTRLNVYVPVGSQPKLVLYVTIESPRLPKTLRYKLSYSR